MCFIWRQCNDSDGEIECQGVKEDKYVMKEECQDHYGYIMDIYGYLDKDTHD